MATEMFPSANMIVSAGDQIDWPESPADQWGKFFSPEKLKSLALSATIGNHEAYAKQEHIYFNSPNTEINGIQYGKTAGGCNNWFTYNDVLFINLNGNSLSAAEHKVFIEHAISQNPDTTWRIVLMHQSLFGATSSYTKESTVNLRAALLPVLSDYDIDAVTGKILRVEKPEQKAASADAKAASATTIEKKQLTKTEAENIALGNSGFQASEVRDLDTELDRDDGVLHYDVDFEKDGYDYEYEIDAYSGKILKSRIERD